VSSFLTAHQRKIGHSVPHVVKIPLLKRCQQHLSTHCQYLIILAIYKFYQIAT